MASSLLKTDEILVSRQDPETRRYSRVGVLSHDGHTFRFKYDDGVTRALPGLRLGRVHESEPLGVLAVSGGGRTGDTYELTPLPQPGPVSLPFTGSWSAHSSS